MNERVSVTGCASGGSNPGGEGPASQCASIPARFRWLKRIVLGYLAFLVALVLVRVWWGWEAQRRYEAALARFEAERPPARTAAGRLEDDENGAVHVVRAYEALAKLGDPQQLETSLAEREPGTAPSPAIRDLLASAGPVLAELRKCRECPAADWTGHTEGGLFRFPVLAHLAGEVAWAQSTAGDQAAALETFRDILALGRTYRQDESLMLSVLLELSAGQVACERIRGILPTLAVTAGVGTAPSTGPAGTGQLRGLIQDLLAESTLRSDWMACFHLEAQQTLGHLGSYLDGVTDARSRSAGSRSSLAVGGPVAPLNAERMLAAYLGHMEAAGAPSWPAARGRIPPLPSFDGHARLYGRLVLAWVLPNLEDVHGRFHACVLQRRATAVALALRWHECEHGRLPQTLAELVPEYLPAIPRDNFAADERPLSYLPQADPPRIYSVWENGLDDGGRGGPQLDFGPNSGPDWVLELPRPALPAAVSPAEPSHASPPSTP